MYRQYPFNEQKQREAKVKVKETDPTWSQDWLFPVTLGPLLLCLNEQLPNSSHGFHFCPLTNIVLQASRVSSH